MTIYDDYADRLESIRTFHVPMVGTRQASNVSLHDPARERLLVEHTRITQRLTIRIDHPNGPDALAADTRRACELIQMATLDTTPEDKRPKLVPGARSLHGEPYPVPAQPNGGWTWYNDPRTVLPHLKDVFYYYEARAKIVYDNLIDGVEVAEFSDGQERLDRKRPGDSVLAGEIDSWNDALNKCLHYARNGVEAAACEADCESPVFCPYNWRPSSPLCPALGPKGRMSTPCYYPTWPDQFSKRWLSDLDIARLFGAPIDLAITIGCGYVPDANGKQTWEASLLNHPLALESSRQFGRLWNPAWEGNHQHVRESRCLVVHNQFTPQFYLDHLIAMVTGATEANP